MIRKFDISLKSTSSGFNIIDFQNTKVGYLDITKDLNITKTTLFGYYNNNEKIKKVFSKVPDNYQFNYYWVDALFIDERFRRFGYASKALSKWFSTLKNPAAIGLNVYPIHNVNLASLKSFYRKHNFRFILLGDDIYALTFLKCIL